MFLEALQPAQLEITLATLDTLEAQAQQVEHQWQLRRERAQYEADLARRRFLAVEPENRLVARSLECDWNEKLAEVERLEKERTTLSRRSPAQMSPEERERILALTQDIPAVWNATTTTHVERKQLLRLLVKDVTITRYKRTLSVAVRWQTGACTLLEVARALPLPEIRRTDPAVVARLRELAPDHTDRQMAEVLNAEGRVGVKGPFTRNKVKCLRLSYGIVAGCPEKPAGPAQNQRGDGCYSAQAVAERLNVHVATIAAWCRQGRLDFVQDAARSPRWFRLTSDVIERLRKPARRHMPRRTGK
jgi:hypothetical protein